MRGAKIPLQKYWNKQSSFVVTFDLPENNGFVWPSLGLYLAAFKRKIEKPSQVNTMCERLFFLFPDIILKHRFKDNSLQKVSSINNKKCNIILLKSNSSFHSLSIPFNYTVIKNMDMHILTKNLFVELEFKEENLTFCKEFDDFIWFQANEGFLL